MEDFLKTLQGFVIPIIVRWIFKVAGTTLVTLGVSEASITEIVTGLVLFLIGAIISLFNHKKAVEQEPKK